MAKAKSSGSGAAIIKQQGDRILDLEGQLADLERELEARDSEPVASGDVSQPDAALVDELEQLRTRVAELEEEQHGQANTGAGALAIQPGKIEYIPPPALSCDGMTIPIPYVQRDSIASVVHGVQFRLDRAQDIYVLDSLFQDLVQRNATVVGPHNTPSPVERHSDAALWLLQQMQLQGMPEVSEVAEQ